MNLGKFQEVWDHFLTFMDRTFQWLMFVFGVTDKWPPEEFPDINA